MKTKTVKQWLKTLPKELSESAISQTSKFQLKQRCCRLSTALVFMCDWHDTKDGFEFWNGLQFNLYWAEQLDNPHKKLKSIFNP